MQESRGCTRRLGIACVKDLHVDCAIALELELVVAVRNLIPNTGPGSAFLTSRHRTGKENKPRTVVDVGCGIGGSVRYLAKKYNANVKAITLSPIQAQRGTAITADQGLSKSVNFQVADAQKQPFSDGEFDLVWSMDSGEHMPDKRKFMQELARVAAPDGRILIVTWCHRDLKPAELSLSPEELELLDKICDAYYLPAWCSPSDYVRIAESIGLKDVKSADWSEYVTPFWPAVMVSALSLKDLFGLAKVGWTTIKGALAMGLMVQGYQRGLIKFALITARKAS